MSITTKKTSDNIVRIFYEDIVIAQSLLSKDKKTTTEFYYKGCYPIFQSLWRRFKTNCESPLELMHEIYLLILTPSKRTGKCQLENFRGESTLRSWIKTVALYYCYKVYDEFILPGDDNKDDESSDRFGDENTTKIIMVNDDSIDIDRVGAVEMDTTNLVIEDTIRLISLMPNKRYAEIMRLFLIEQLSNDEVASALGMSKANLYNKHILAIKQFEVIRRKEERYV